MTAQNFGDFQKRNIKEKHLLILSALLYTARRLGATKIGQIFADAVKLFFILQVSLGTPTPPRDSGSPRP
jgi:hypothetical protein